MDCLPSAPFATLPRAINLYTTHTPPSLNCSVYHHLGGSLNRADVGHEVAAPPLHTTPHKARQVDAWEDLCKWQLLCTHPCSKQVLEHILG
jgi:hypothetical protein